MISIALCEDNLIHQRHICRAIHSVLGLNHSIDVYSSAHEFRAAVLGAVPPSFSYDIILMDIELGDDSGIILTKEINRHFPNTQIIYITQHLEYVSSVYDTQHMYFIEKRNMDLYLPRAFNIALNRLHRLDTLQLEFTWNKESFIIPQKNIIYMERVLRTTEIHTFSQIFYTSEKLPEILQKLEDSFFICHRSFLINLNMISNLEKAYVTLNSDIQIPVSRAHYNDLKDKFNLLIAK